MNISLSVRGYFLAALLLLDFFCAAKSLPAYALSFGGGGFAPITYQPNVPSIPTYATFGTASGSTITLHPVGTQLDGNGNAIINTQSYDGKTYYIYGNCSGTLCSADRVAYDPVSGDYKVLGSSNDAIQSNNLISVQGGTGPAPTVLSDNPNFQNPDVTSGNLPGTLDISANDPFNTSGPQIPDAFDPNLVGGGLTPAPAGLPAGELIDPNNPLPVNVGTTPGVDTSLDPLVLDANGNAVPQINGTLTNYVPQQGLGFDTNNLPTTNSGLIKGGFDTNPVDTSGGIGGSGGGCSGGNCSLSQGDPFGTGSGGADSGGLSGLLGGGGGLGSLMGGGGDTPFGGAIIIILPCADGNKWMTITGPTAGIYIWTLGTKTYLNGPPSHPGQWLLGTAGGNKICIGPGGTPLPPGKEMKMVGTSP